MLRRVLAGALAATALVLVVRDVRPPPDPLVAVVVADRRVAAGTVLGVDDVRLQPVEVPQPGAVVTLAQAVGRRLVAGLAQGEAVTATRLVPRGVADGLPAGRVALHVVAADPASVDLLRPGAQARVYAVSGGTPLARSALVLSADPPPPETTARSAASRGVVLALSADEADSVLAGHGGLEGPVTVGLLAVPP